MSKISNHNEGVRASGMVSMLALCIATFSSPALAQEAPVAGQAPVAEDGPAPGEIVVTAQRRSERLTDVPVSVTVLSAATIAATGVTDTYSLQQITPGLRMERSEEHTSELQ